MCGTRVSVGVGPLKAQFHFSLSPLVQGIPHALEREPPQEHIPARAGQACWPDCGDDGAGGHCGSECPCGGGFDDSGGDGRLRRPRDGGGGGCASVEGGPGQARGDGRCVQGPARQFIQTAFRRYSAGESGRDFILFLHTLSTTDTSLVSHISAIQDPPPRRS